jgi:hypothetical protein
LATCHQRSSRPFTPPHSPRHDQRTERVRRTGASSMFCRWPLWSRRHDVEWQSWRRRERQPPPDGSPLSMRISSSARSPRVGTLASDLRSSTAPRRSCGV